jgi:hypothetical protein
MQDWMSKLERAKALFDAGALTRAEFEAEKLRLLPHALAFERPEQQEGETGSVDGRRLSEGGISQAEPRRSLSSFRTALLSSLIVVTAATGYLLSEAGPSSPSKDLTQTEPSTAPPHAETVERGRTLPVTRALPAVQAGPEAKPVSKTANTFEDAAADEPKWTPAQYRLISTWSKEMEVCDPGAEESEEITSACARLEAIEEEMKENNICTATIPETDAVALRRCR